MEESIKIAFSSAPPDPMATPVEPRKESRVNDINYWPYFEDNLFPETLADSSDKSPTNSGIITKKTAMVQGKSLKVVAKQPGEQSTIDRITENMDDGGGLFRMVYKLANDYIRYGGYAIQPIGVGEKLANIEHVDWSYLRKGWRMIEGDSGEFKQKGYILSPYWRDGVKKVSENGCSEWLLPYTIGCEFAEGRYYVFIRKEYTSRLQHYPLPSWYSGLSSSQTEINLLAFKNANVQNSFNPSGILFIEGKHDPERVEAIKKEFMDEMLGAHNTGKVAIIMGMNKPEFTPLTTSPAQRSVQEYQDACVQELVMAHRVPSMTLLGLKGGPSLSGDATTISTSYKIFMEESILPIRRMILNDVQRFYRDMGYDVSIESEDYQLDPEETGAGDMTSETDKENVDDLASSATQMQQVWQQ